jgi:hypothetical protein
MRNPVAALKHYRLYTIYKIPSLRLLDFKKIKEKVTRFYNQYFQIIFYSQH